MKALFLDVDGVINKQENFRHSKGVTPYPIDSYCAFLVARIVANTDCEVILSSSWRNYPDAVKIVTDSVVPILDVTKNFSSRENADGKNITRGEEVREWLSRHPEVTRYAILDDDSDFEWDLPLFQTTFKDGLTDEIAQKVIEHLNA